jgi:hypothetical protein
VSVFFLNWYVLLICISLGCAGNNSGESIPRDESKEFANPERVTILGYNDHAMEPHLSPDGHTLYFVDGCFAARGIPQTADIFIAERSGKNFLRPANSAVLMKQINTDLLEYASAVSASGLEIFFTRLKGDIPAIYTATRTSTSAPFNAPKKIQAISGFVEGPALSNDEKLLYYHRYENNRFVIYRVKR